MNQQQIQPLRATLRLQLEPLFFEHIQADQPQIAYIFLHQIRDIVIAHPQ